MSLFSTAGTKWFIGSAIADKNVDFVLADFAGQAWTEIKNTTNLIAVGDTSALISSDQINVARTKKLKGTRNAGGDALICDLDWSDAGQLACIAAEKTPYNYPFKVLYNDAPPVLTATVTMTIASPGVVSWANHGLIAGDAVSFSTTVALPTGLTAGTTYYVLSSGLTSGAFQVAATPGGAAIVTSGTQSGVHTGSTVPSGSQRYFIALVMSATEVQGGANDPLKLNVNIEVNSNLVRVSAAN